MSDRMKGGKCGSHFKTDTKMYSGKKDELVN
jgi:hypothetical protein